MTYVNASLRRLVIERAGNCCEYCRLSQEDVAFSFHIEHIIAEKHGGITLAHNLCLSCPDCNFNKGSDLASIDWDGSGDITALFNPRKQVWAEHFQSTEIEIQPLTAEGRVSVFLLRLNSSERLAERNMLIELGRYPCI